MDAHDKLTMLRNKLHGVIIAILVCLAASTVSAGTVDDAQRMLSRLGYNPGPIDGAYGGQTRSALENFYSDNGSVFDGQLDQNEISDLSQAITEAGISMTPQSGVEIENAYMEEDILYLIQMPLPSAIDGRYWWAWTPFFADFNNDGILDIFLTGVKPGEAHKDENGNYTGTTTGDICGPEKNGCPGPNAVPSMFIGTGDDTYNLRDDLIIDNRDDPGQSLARQNLVADYNGDGILDMYVADTGNGSHDGYRDSYYLSQPNGTWLESSNTHLSQPGFVTFDHGAATGDIDGDGDMDVIINDPADGGKMQCLFNDGSGYLTQEVCGRIHAFTMELVDWDGDGDLDILHFSGQHPWPGNWEKGISYNDGTGNFSYRSVELTQVHPGSNERPWVSVGDITAWDLDGDGDQDLVNSINQHLYAGVAIEIVENLGDGQTDTQLYEILLPPVGFVSQCEGSGCGNFWNRFVEQMLFADLDDDGDIDIMLVNKGTDHMPDEQGVSTNLPNGSWMRNDGKMNFTFMYGPQGSRIQFIESSDILIANNEVQVRTPTRHNPLRQAIPGDGARASVSALCENATVDGEWDMENEYWVYHAQHRGMDLEFCLNWLQ